MSRQRRSVGGRTEEEWRLLVDDALQEGAALPSLGRSAAGDPRALRRLSMIGGAAGAVPGTEPHRQRRLDRWQGRR